MKSTSLFCKIIFPLNECVLKPLRLLAPLPMILSVQISFFRLLSANRIYVILTKTYITNPYFLDCFYSGHCTIFNCGSLIITIHWSTTCNYHKTLGSYFHMQPTNPHFLTYILAPSNHNNTPSFLCKDSSTAHQVYYFHILCFSFINMQFIHGLLQYTPPIFQVAIFHMP